MDEMRKDPEARRETSLPADKAEPENDAPGTGPDSGSPSAAAPENAGEPRILSAAALRALAEAEERRARAAREAQAKPAAREIGGRGGPDPARYGDWEIDGRAIDF